MVNDRVQVAEGGDASRPSKAAGNAPPDVASLSQVAGDEGKGGKAVYFKKVRWFCVAPSAQHTCAPWNGSKPAAWCRAREEAVRATVASHHATRSVR